MWDVQPSVGEAAFAQQRGADNLCDSGTVNLKHSICPEK
jgi:hypothetical protein